MGIMSEEMTVDKEKWSQEIGIGQRNQTLAACINSLIAHKRGVEWNEETAKRYLVIWKTAVLLSGTKRSLIRNGISEKSFRMVSAYLICLLIAAKDSSERSCSILQASSFAISSGTPIWIRYFVSAWCRS